MKSSLSREQHLDLYYFMQLNRQLEDRMVRLFRQNKIVGGLYSSLGQEACSVGTAFALEKRDWIAPMIRNIGALLTKGVAPRSIFTQHMARYTSPTLGKDGTSHFGDLDDLHIVSPISMLGDLIPVMAGIGIAGRYLGQNIVTMTWIGDGGSSTGVFHEGLNFAAVQRAPLVLVLENNQWAYSTPVSRQVPVTNLADRGKAYGVQTYVVDGTDAVAVYETTRQAVAQCRAGEGPVLIEAKMMRMRGHAQHDPAEYVPKEMFEYWKARDPIARYEKYLTENKLWDVKKKGEIDARIEKELDVEQKFAEESPFPLPEDVDKGVFCEGCHDIKPMWKRSKAEVTPPKSSVQPVWKVASFGDLEGGGVNGTDTAAAIQKASAQPGTDGARPPAAKAAAKATKKKKPAGKAARAAGRK